jgi:hypothetical protein
MLNGVERLARERRARWHGLRRAAEDGGACHAVAQALM